MMTIRKLVPVLLLLLLPVGCVTNTITNLTPRQLSRNANGLYLFEVALDSNQQTLRDETIQAQVLIGMNSYPMEPVLMLKNRWEALVPHAATNRIVNFQFKLNYTYNRFGSPGTASILSQSYSVEIIDK